MNVTHYALLVSEKGTSHFARMVTPCRDNLGPDLGSLAMEYLAEVSELPECDPVLDCWDAVKLFLDGGVLDVSIDDMTHLDAQDSPNPPVQKYFEGIKKSLPKSPALASPQQKITRNGLE